MVLVRRASASGNSGFSSSSLTCSRMLLSHASIPSTAGNSARDSTTISSLVYLSKRPDILETLFTSARTKFLKKVWTDPMLRRPSRNMPSSCFRSHLPRRFDDGSTSTARSFHSSNVNLESVLPCAKSSRRLRRDDQSVGHPSKTRAAADFACLMTILCCIVSSAVRRSSPVRLASEPSPWRSKQSFSRTRLEGRPCVSVGGG
ncbi:hypothetical protein F4810DRAFT_666352 [Camillea tinctor]|nr:hypothetical protein F4810DRAFT_666352 [Camillea tinctor]